MKDFGDYWKGASDARGMGGEWRVEQQRLSWDILEHFAEAVMQAGIPAISDFNRGGNLGVSYFEVNQKCGTRLSRSGPPPPQPEDHHRRIIGQTAAQRSGRARHRVSGGRRAMPCSLPHRNGTRLVCLLTLMRRS